MNNTKQIGFLGFLKVVFASFGAEQAGEIKIRNEKPSKRKVATVKKASVRRNDWNRTMRRHSPISSARLVCAGSR